MSATSPLVAYTQGVAMDITRDVVKTVLFTDQPLNLALTLESGQAFRWHLHGAFVT